jgi:Alpha-L-arabinofuranosidase
MNKLLLLIIIFCGSFVSLFSQSSNNCFLEDFIPKNAVIPTATLTDKTTQTPTVTVNITPDTLGKISKYVFGNAIAVWMGNNTGNTGFVKNTQALSPTLIRFPGGSWSNIFFWNGKPSDIPDSIYDGTTYNGTTAKKNQFYAISGVNDWSTTVDNYYKLRQQVGTQGLITINYGYARYGLSNNPVQQAAHLAADWVRYDKGRTKFWEIGNENPGPWEAGWMIDTAKNKDGQPQIINGQLYGRHFCVFADSMRAAAAQIGAKIYIGALILHYDGSTSWNSVDRTWNASVFKEVGDSADFYVMHNYFGGGADVNSLLSTATTEPKKNISFIRQDIVNKKAFLKPVALTEYNMDGNSAGAGPLHSYINGMQATILFNELLKNNFGLGARWLLASGDDGMFYQGSNSSLLWQPRPDFYYAYYQQKFTGDHMIATTSTNANILAYASRYASGETGLVIVNKGTSSQVVKVNPKNVGVGEKYYVYSLTGGSDNGDFSSYVTVNGVAPTGTQWGPRTTLETIPASAFPNDSNILIQSPGRSVQFVMVDSGPKNPIPTIVNNIQKPQPKVVNYPNPFETNTTIEFQTLKTSHVSLTVYNQTGEKISTLVDQTLPSGLHSFNFDGSSLPKGVYFYKLQVDNDVITQKMVLVK